MPKGQKDLETEVKELKEQVAELSWTKDYIEYVKEDGQWKFLKLIYRLTYMTPYEKGWMEEPQGASITAAHAEFPPDKPCTYHLPYNRYRVNVFQPMPPEPFDD